MKEDKNLIKQALQQIENPETSLYGWGTLYRVSASYFEAGKPLPSEMSQIIAERLSAISTVLLSDLVDIRKLLPDAVMTKKRRSKGRPAKKNKDVVFDKE